ncbi:uncharacterized protein FA14DRAFT_152372 [Meira miltonrushii]|uniref:Uncharacterized protein n=1 Tax=Meira miltonrushii TaxID=1280837 RepID=A0A316VHE9_9BASI|nr:uncharacterized protein FA14DRAFT_152372 [Meira miltonrushii]PWN36950.1 hypothetical protein FA14DRAFT_152372 [Meira miltonrushii]
MTPEIVSLKARDIAIGGSSISLISIILIAVGGGAMILSVVGVTFYVLHVRRKRRRRNLIPQAKAGESILIKTPKTSIKGVVDGKGMTPAMRMAADVRRISNEQQNQWTHHDSTRSSGERVSAYRENMIPPSAHARIMHTLPSTSSQYSFTSSSGPYPHSSEGMSTTYSSYSQQAGSYASVEMPPLPANSHHMIQKAQSQPTQKAPSVKSIRISRKPIYPDGEIQQEIQQEVQYLPQLPQPAALQQRPTPSLNTVLPVPQRSLSPNPAASIDGSESFTPVLDLGMEFGGQRSNQESPFEVDNSVMEQSSWLASALDSAFNSDGPSFEEPPRRAPQIPKPVVHAPAGHASKASISSTKSHSKKASKSSRPPPPATGPPKKHEKPTTGGPSRVTVDYYTPYSRRTLYQESANEVRQQTEEKVEVLAPAEVLPSDQTHETGAGRASVESAVRAAALFSSMEPVLRSNENSLDLSLDRSSFSQADHGGSFSAVQDGNSTIHTSVVDGDQSRRSGSSEGHKMPVPTMTFDHTTEQEMFPSDLRSNSMKDRQPFSRNLPALQIPSDLIDECQAAISSDDKNVPLMNTFDNTGLQKTISNKPSFASNLRAKLSMSRSKSSNSAASSGGRVSPNATQVEETGLVASRSPQLGAIPGVSPALSSNSFMDGTPNSFVGPTETWNLSTDDIEMPQFVQRSSSSIEAERSSPINPGLGLQSGSQKTVDVLRSSNSLKRKGSNASKRSLKQKAMINRNTQRESAFSLERNNSTSSYGSSSQSHEFNRAFPWSRMQGPSSTKQNDTYDVIEEEHRQSNNSSPRFADAEPSSSTSADSVGYNLIAASSMDHTTNAIQSIQAHDQGQQQKWLNLNRDVQRDSIASSYCDTILSSDNGDAESAFDYENAQDQRAKLLQSIQKRNQAKQALTGHGRSSSRQMANKQSIREELEEQQGGFTSHSARLSIDVGQNASLTKTKSGNELQALNIDMGESFLGGHGILTPPLTPYEKTIALPELEVEVKQKMIPDHARIKKQPTLTPEERQAERLSKLRPLSLAANQASHTSGAGVPVSPLPHLNQSSHRPNASRSSSAFGLSPSTSYGSAFGTGLQLSSISYTTSPTRPLFSTANKRVSRASSATGSINHHHGPMGVARSAGLSTQVSHASPSSILINSLPGLPDVENDSQASTPKVSSFAAAQALRARSRLSSSSNAQLSLTPSMINAAQQSWLSAANNRDGNATSGMSVHRLSGSSFASNTSLLNRFPITANAPMV